MIIVKKPLSDFTICNCCSDIEDVMDIIIRYDNTNQGNCISLCNRCRKELIEKVSMTTK